MKGLTKDEKSATLDSFLEPDDSGLETVDRSELDQFANCPFAAKARADGRCKTVGLAAEAGEAIHHCNGKITQRYVQGEWQFSETKWQERDEIRQALEAELRSVRPDLQPEALAGMMPSAWAWSKFLSGINPGNVLAFDGGDECGRSSQFAYDMPDLSTRATSELDLVYANPQTTDLVEFCDYKTGHATHEVYDVAKSFQFQMHALLLLKRFPEVKAARLRVWDTRANHVTYTVTFPRERLADYEWRVRAATETRRKWRNDPNPPTWPTIEKCSVCPAACICPVAEYPMNASPEAVLGDLIAVEARASELKKHLTNHINSTKRDVQFGSTFYGKFQKPDSEKKVGIYYRSEHDNDAGRRSG